MAAATSGAESASSKGGKDRPAVGVESVPSSRPLQQADGAPTPLLPTPADRVTDTGEKRILIFLLDNMGSVLMPTSVTSLAMVIPAATV